MIMPVLGNTQDGPRKTKGNVPLAAANHDCSRNHASNFALLTPCRRCDDDGCVPDAGD